MVAPKLGVAVRISLSSSSLSLYYTTKKRETTIQNQPSRRKNNNTILVVVVSSFAFVVDFAKNRAIHVRVYVSDDEKTSFHPSKRHERTKKKERLYF